MPDSNRSFLGLTIDRHVSISNLVTTIAAIVAGTLAYANMENRVSELEKSDQRMEKIIEDQKSEHRYTLERIYTELGKMNEKVDNINEKMGTKADR